MSTVELDCEISVQDVPDVRRLVERLHRKLGEDIATQVAMTTHELLENAIKFSTDGAAMLRIEVDAAGKVEIRTRNRARPENLKSLEALAARLDNSVDPMLFYIDLMKRSPRDRGGLGIGRVAAEADMKLDFAFNGDEVHIVARSLAAAA